MTNGKNSKPYLIMMYISLSTFTKRDLFLLSNDFHVDSYHFNTKKKWKLPFAFLKQAWFLVVNYRKIDIIITQSAGYLSFLPAVFNKFFKTPLVIIAIGTDCIKLPEINYGAHTKPILAWFTRFSFRNSKIILPVHKSLEWSNYTYFPLKYPIQGIKAFVSALQTPIVEVVNGFDAENWKITHIHRPQNSFLTITTSLNKTGFSLKGIDLLLEIAILFPQFNFTIVGKVIMEEILPPNVQVLDHVPHEKLLDIYNHHQYYLQLSMSEGFPNTLCEAMLCGCIPIGSNVAGIPDIIGEEGYVLTKKEIAELENIFNSLQENKINPIHVRQRIIDNFPLEKRKIELINAIKQIIVGFQK